MAEQKRGQSESCALALEAFCPEGMHIISTHISLAGASHIAIHDFKWAGKDSPTICMEGERSGTFVTNLKAFLNMVKTVRDLELDIRVLAPYLYLCYHGEVILHIGFGNLI